MKAARAPRAEKTKVKLLVVQSGKLQDSLMEALPQHLRAGDLLVVNDAATLPASLPGHDAHGHPLELRLTMQLDAQVWQAVALGAGDWHTPTEDRPAPLPLQQGEEIHLAPNFRARVLNAASLSDRLLQLQFNLSGEALWHSLYQHGKPVQYSYLNDDLKLWSVQNIYSSRPWAVEMPSAGHALNWQLLLQLIRKGVQVISLTHGAGLSATGDERIDSALPLAERFEIPAATMEAWQRTKANGGRVIAMGTSVVRALESAGLNRSGVTTLRLGPGYQRRVVDGLLTGTHDVSESHYQLLRAFLPEQVLTKVSQHLEEQNYLTHEFGDLCLVLAQNLNLEIRDWRSAMTDAGNLIMEDDEWRLQIGA
ncbi:MAG TPA: S-adenosylmethionine:tRNA ribosyltransferase-isomerase [Blastocatellia bacterium]|nr:S-adenosylmethionine:tRNA ribosyltransferase-isomerase [Blastocatellia bacterium]